MSPAGESDAWDGIPFAKYQALGNDYIVIEAARLAEPSPALVRRICDRHRGLGGDGILLDGPREGGRFRLRILNPDGSEAEKSGNGLRIHARYLFDRGRVGGEPFEVVTAGGVVRCRVDASDSIQVEMGAVTFASGAVPTRGAEREVVDEALEVEGESLRIAAAGVGNPHCVVLTGPVSEERARRLGPRIERHPLFPNRTNVQLLEVVDRHTIRLEIWERGAGYTLASGSSSCAAAAAAVRLGLCESPIEVRMPGGSLEIEVGDGYRVTLRGPAACVATGLLAPELLEAEPVREGD